MDYEMIKNNFLLFLEQYDPFAKEKYWQGQRKLFYDFWENKIKNDNYQNLLKADTDEVINIIDDHARGHKGNKEAIAKAGIYQNHWEKAFKDLKRDKELMLALDKILYARDDSNLADMIDELLFINKNNKNGMNGEKKIMINAFLFLKNPEKYISIISLYHRKLIIKTFGLASWVDNFSIGHQIVWSNDIILNGLHEKLKMEFTPRTISEFLYLPHGNYEDVKIKYLWYKKIESKKKNDEVFSELKLQPLKKRGEKEIKFDGKKFHHSLLEIQEDNQLIGKIGEDFVLEQEKIRLQNAGRPDLAGSVENLSDTKCGYDILSYDINGQKRYIEVKSTRSKKGNGFFITRNEIFASEKYKDNYYLYVVVNVSVNPKIKYYKSPDFSDSLLFRKEAINYFISYN